MCNNNFTLLFAVVARDSVERVLTMYDISSYLHKYYFYNDDIEYYSSSNNNNDDDDNNNNNAI